jgi:AcrR family transcriptional regulator
MGIQERKEREKERRREEILDAAQRVFAEKGLTIATVDDIVTAAEISKGTLYLHFQSKEDVYLALMTRGLRVLRSRFGEIISHETSVVKTLQKLDEAYVEFFQTQKHYFRMLNTSHQSNVHGQVSEGMKGEYAAESRENWEQIIDLFNRGVREGKIRDDINSVDMAIIIWSNLTSLMTRIDREGETWKQERNIDLTKTLEASFHLLMDAILTPDARLEFDALRAGRSVNSDNSRKR